MSELAEPTVDPAARRLVPGEWRPLPTPSWLTRPFWDAAARGELVVQRCTRCGLFVFRPQYACTRCLSTELAWQRSGGIGTVHSFSIVQRPAYPELPVPYAVVVVAIDEAGVEEKGAEEKGAEAAWYMMSNLIDCSVDDVRTGMEVQVAFRDVGGMSLPFVAPRRSVVADP